MTTQDLRTALTGELHAKTSAPVLAAVASALGATLSDPTDAVRSAAELPGVDGYYISYGTEILSVYLLSDGRLIRYELSRDGRYLLVGVPMSRVARVAETNENERLTILVELDADRRSFTLSGSVATLAGTGVESAGQRLNLEGTFLSSAFVIEAPASEAGGLAEFAQQLRRGLR